MPGVVAPGELDGRASASFRAWLFQIATNACLDVHPRPAARTLRRRRPARRRRPDSCRRRSYVAPAVSDSFLEPVAPREVSPTRWCYTETIELAFSPLFSFSRPDSARPDPAGRVKLVGKDGFLRFEVSVAAVNSALQRARATLRRTPAESRQPDWPVVLHAPSGDQRELLRRYVEAHERADADALAALLREDAQLLMPPHPTWYTGRDAIVIATQKGFDPAFGSLRTILLGANAAGGPLPARPGRVRLPTARVRPAARRGGLIAEIASFVSTCPSLLPAFGLPPTLDR